MIIPIILACVSTYRIIKHKHLFQFGKSGSLCEIIETQKKYFCKQGK